MVACVFVLLKPSLISAGGATGRLNIAPREPITIIPTHNAAKHPTGAAATIRMVFLIFIDLFVDYFGFVNLGESLA